MDWSPEQLQVIRFFRGNDWNQNETMSKGDKAWVSKVPPRLKRYKCFVCYKVVDIDDIEETGKCPNCGNANMVEMCPLDHVGCCSVGIVPQSGIEHCPVCGDPICPSCATHDVFQLSRVTGYYQAVSGFNEAKKQELKDRHRTTLEELRR